MTPANAAELAAWDAKPHRKGTQRPEPRYEEWAETFTVRPALPGGLVVDIATSVGVDGQGNLTYGRSAVMRFVSAAVIDADTERLDQLLHDPDRVVELDDLGPVMLWIVGLANSSRPTGPPTS